MLESGGRARRALIALATGTLMLGLLPGAAAAATPFTVDMDLYAKCFTGGPLANGAVVNVSQKRDLWVIAKTRVVVRNNRFRACVKQLQPADAIVITSGAKKRAFNLPFISATLDLATDKADGAVPFNSTAVTINLVKVVDGYPVTTYTHVATQGNSQLDPDGTWEADFSGDLDTLGGDRLMVDWTDSRNDHFRLTVTNPAAWVVVGKSTAGVAGEGGSKATITDRVGATLKSKGTVAIPKDRPWTKVTLRAGRVAKTVAVGDRITHSALPGKLLDAIANTMSLSRPDGGSLTATCWEGGRYAVVSGGVVRASGVAGAGGAVSASNLLGAGDPMPVGTVVALACMTPDALGQIFTATAS